MIHAEWLAIVRNKMLLLSIIAVILIPTLYSGLFVWAFWDPYGKIKQLPVAVVNLDQPIRYKGETISAGDDIVGELRKDKNVKWKFVSKQNGTYGLRKNRYYAMIQIPKDFSKDVISVIQNKPKRATIEYIPNTGYNFVSTKITDTASEKLRETISENITKHYTDVLFKQFGNISNAIDKASKGANHLSSGLDNLYTKSNQLLSGLIRQQSSINELASGASLLYQKTSELSNGLVQFERKLDTISADARNLALFIDQNYPKLRAGLTEITNRMDRVTSIVNQSRNQMNQMKYTTARLQSDLKQYAAMHPEATNDPNFQALLTLSQDLANSMTAAEFTSIENELSTMASRLQTFKTKHETLFSSVQPTVSAQFNTYLNQFRKAASGSIALKRGAKKISEGTSQAAKGWQTLIQSVTLLATGEKKLLDGSKNLSKGLGDLSNAVGKVKGANNARNAMFAAPVKIKRQELTKGITYGAGFTPYFLSLGLFVGPLMLTTVYSLKDPASRPASGLQWFLGKYSVLFVVLLGQSLISASFLLLAFHMKVASTPLFLLFSFIASISFSSLIMFLATALGNPGRFIALIVLILQLTTSGGSYPVELIAPALQPLHRFLPMSYAVAGFRDVMFTSDFSAMWQQAAILSVYFIVSLFLLIVFFSYSFKKIYRKKEA
ncbi:YhgE/Pip family protein [Fictibacillus gelatini]|uniref:YhgE/Pip family protein n=1 Tax=Fictibacillus gelatini TaxID=225985 RepID=UPI00041986C7|nr:YhgE/Pip domain-containing protein [Fictibacillus gelatini]